MIRLKLRKVFNLCYEGWMHASFVHLLIHIKSFTHQNLSHAVQFWEHLQLLFAYAWDLGWIVTQGDYSLCVGPRYILARSQIGWLNRVKRWDLEPRQRWD